MNFILLEKLLEMAAVAITIEEFLGAGSLIQFGDVFSHNNHKIKPHYFHQCLVQAWLEVEPREVMRSLGWLIWLDQSGRSLQVFAHIQFFTA